VLVELWCPCSVQGVGADGLQVSLQLRQFYDSMKFHPFSIFRLCLFFFFLAETVSFSLQVLLCG